MTSHRRTGWNTWDFRGFNRLVFLRRGRAEITVQVAIWDEDVPPPTPGSRQLGRLHDKFRWTDVTHLGPHGPLGLPAELEFRVGEVLYRLTATDQNGALHLAVVPLSACRYRVVFILASLPGERPGIQAPDSGTLAGWALRFEGVTWPRRYFLNIAEPYVVADPGQPAALIATNPRREMTSAGSLADHERTAIAGTGALADAPRAMMQAVNWNTLYDTRRGLISSPVSRDWCDDWAGVLVFCWDTFFAGAMASLESPELARLNFEAVTQAVDEIGHVPNYYMAHGAVSLDRSMPPLGSWLIWKTQAVRPDKAWLTGIYRRLTRWHRYWMKNRDGNGDGLLEWGSNAEPRYEFPQLLPYNPSLQHTAKCAMYESGLDNSPMYDDVPFNEQTNTFELVDVGLNSYYAMDCEALGAMAEVLGKPKDAHRYRREYEAIKHRINELLWDEAHGIYANRHWDGRFSARWSPTSFFPLIAGIAPPDRAGRIVREHLLNEQEFWGRYLIPSIARNDPAFPDNDYWRGRIWGPFNFLVAEGLRRYRLDNVAAELSHRGLEMFLENWRGDGGVYENYNATTGKGGDVWNAARLYHWGGLMAYIAIGELVDVEPPGFLRFGSIGMPPCGVRNVHIGDDAFDVEIAEGLCVRRNGQTWLECDTRAIIRLPLRPSDEAPIQIAAAGTGRLRMAGDVAAARVALVNGNRRSPQATGSDVVYEWGAG
ncbi:MAG: hypothetical protein HY718_12170 [Planctomycetes bacterium]|nr:hypothetical protein [Planctomycetota bacterium]